ncbi:MAG TPA: hypothetical protein VJ947_03765, partial [Pseudohaliea sp.]|nr:hypothetical protein [Pseudohaliea sp.]
MDRGEARRPLRRLVLPFVLLFLAGCASVGVPVASLAPAAVELDATPFFPQQRYQCGPAALATVLSASGVPVEPAALVDEVYIP